MAFLDPASLQWAVDAAAPGAEVIEVRGLRDGGSPWLIRPTAHRQERNLVLRVGTDQDPGALPTEVAALQLAAEHDIPAPRLLAADLDRTPPLVLVEQLPGSSKIPRDRPSERLRTLGRTAAMLHVIPLHSTPELPSRDRPIASVDFAALRRQHPPNPLLIEAEEQAADSPPDGPTVFVHGDLWQGNALWTDNTLTGLIDWDCAGTGAPLSTPPDMGWFPAAIAGQGRPDLTQQRLLRRRDEFLRHALAEMSASGG